VGEEEMKEHFHEKKNPREKCLSQFLPEKAGCFAEKK